MRNMLGLQVTEIAPEDLKLPNKPVSRLKRLGARHHAAARMMANGYSDAEISAAIGYTPSTLSILKNDPSFQDLIAHYRVKVDEINADFTEMLKMLQQQAAQELLDRLENEPEEISASTLRKIIETGADRTGFGPTSTVNQNVGIADKLKDARKRLEERMIDITPKEEK